jgi:AcrR family transcriptional regulator
MNVRAYRSPRREQAAADTRTAILDAAERLFAEHGYARTTVAQVAAAADVAANTVYTSVGGKPQLVVALTERGTDDPNLARVLQDIDAMTDGTEIVRRLATGTAVTRRNQCHTIAVMWDNTTSDPLIAQAAELAMALTRARLAQVADRLAAIGALRKEITAERAADVLWFYFGFTAWRGLHDLGWDWADIGRWLAEQASGALLVGLAAAVSSPEWSGAPAERNAGEGTA